MLRSRSSLPRKAPLFPLFFRSSAGSPFTSASLILKIENDDKKYYLCRRTKTRPYKDNRSADSNRTPL